MGDIFLVDPKTGKLHVVSKNGFEVVPRPLGANEFFPVAEVARAFFLHPYSLGRLLRRHRIRGSKIKNRWFVSTSGIEQLMRRYPPGLRA